MTNHVRSVTERHGLPASHLTRRAFIGGSAALAAASTGLVTGCAGTTETGPVPVAERVALPTRVPFEGAPPDLKGENGSTDAYLHYPAEPVVTVPERPGDGQPVTAMAASYVPTRPAMADNGAWQYLNEQLGSDFAFQEVPAGDYNARFSTMVASDDLPSMVQLAKVGRLPDLVSSEFIDLTEHLSGDAVKKYPNLANLHPAAWRAGIINNAIYGIPTDSGMWGSGILLVRTDVVSEFGLDADDVTDFSTFEAFCTELTNERDSIWALPTVPTSYLRQMAGAPNKWQVDDGKLISAHEAPEQEEVLRAGLKLLKAGVVHPDAFALNGSQRKQLFNSGRTILTNDSYPAWFQAEREQTVGDRYRVGGMPLPGLSGGTGSFHIGRQAFAVSGIPKGNEDRIDTILNVWNYLTAPFGSVEYLTVIFGKEGEHYNLDGSDPIPTPLGAAEPLSLVALLAAPRVAYHPADPQVAEDFYHHMRQMAATNAVTDPTSNLYSATSTEKGGEIDGRINDDFDQILQGNKPLSSWQESVETWRKNGGDQIRGEFEEALAAEL